MAARWVRVLVLLALASCVAQALARDGESRTRKLGKDVFAAGASVYAAQPVEGDLIAAGGEVRVAAPVAGDVLAAGGQLLFDGTVARNAHMAGGRVALGPSSRIEGNASIAGGHVEVRGAIDGYLQAAGGEVLIDGPVQGDVEVAAGELELGPRARIGGTLRYWGGEPLERHASAQVLGGVVEREVPRREPPELDEVAGAAFGVWTLGLMILAAVLVAALPAAMAKVAAVASARFGWSLLVGFIALAAAPLAIVLLLVTVVGIPLALLALLAFPALLLVGYVASGVVLGTGILARLQPARAQRTGWRAAAGALGVLLLALAAMVPWVGPLVALVALIAGVGALLLATRVSGAAASGEAR